MEILCKLCNKRIIVDSHYIHGNWYHSSCIDELVHKTIPQICCICGREYSGMGNNPVPVKQKGRCCDMCNELAVIPARLRELDMLGNES